MYKNGKTCSTCMYIHEDLTIKERPYLSDSSPSMISVTVGRPNEQKVNVISFYHQWAELNEDKAIQLQSTSVNQQAERFGRIIDCWTKSIDEGKETITI